MSVLVGRKAPDFTTPAVLSDGTLKDDFNFATATKGKYGLLFFYPLNFTFVCPSELVAVHNRIGVLQGLGVETVGISIDSHHSHAAFRNTSTDDGGIGNVGFTLAADLNHDICQAYGVQSEGGESYYEAGVAMRATFITDRRGIVRHQVVNDEPIGRNMDEVVRVIEALQFHENNGQVCPAGWQKGQEGMKPTSEGVAQYLGRYWSNL